MEEYNPTHKIILTDKVFDREIKAIFKGTLIECLREMDDRTKYKKCGDHYETADHLCNVSIDKLYKG